MLYLIVIILGVVIDQLVKLWVTNVLPLGGGWTVMPELLEIHYIQNTGAAWSLFDGNTMALALFSVLMELFLAGWFWKTPKEKVGERLALCLMLSGAFGNMIDRFRLGYVVDFIHLPHWPIFNIADMLLCIGAALLAYILIREGLWEKKQED